MADKQMVFLKYECQGSIYLYQIGLFRIDNALTNAFIREMLLLEKNAFIR